MDFVKLPIWFGTYMDYLWLCRCLLLTMSLAWQFLYSYSSVLYCQHHCWMCYDLYNNKLKDCKSQQIKQQSWRHSTTKQEYKNHSQDSVTNK